MVAQTVLEELTGDELNRDHVEQRLNDWSARIDDLYRDVESWLPAGWTARRGPPVTMLEPPMQRLGIGPRELATLELLHNGKVAAVVRPYGLWIIGANGRVDLITDDEFYYVVDRAKIFEPADWHVSRSNARHASRRLDGQQLAAAILR